MSDEHERLVVVSNRVINPEKPAAGGLAVALGEMMYNTDGLWFGWSGKTTDEPDPKSIKTEPFGRTTLATVDLSQRHHDDYYAGFSNSVLWPIFHQKGKWAELKPEYFNAYVHVNKMLASQLAPMLQDNDVVWIHDYHLIPFAQELRALGCKQRIGFFNHIPLPPPDAIKQIPWHGQLMEALFSYDLVGMQSAKDVENLRQYVEMEGVGQRQDNSHIDAFGKKTSVQAFPIGIDTESLMSLVPSSTSSQAIMDEVRNESSKRLLMVGVDRLDYSKGVPKRLKAFRELLLMYPEMKENVTFVQIAAPTRQGVFAYDQLSRKTSGLVNKINAQFGTDTWKPVLYFNTSVERNSLVELYRLSRVGVVTPKADGMNLVAKEYVAAQTPEDPGVLVLSTEAGAASQLRESLLVEPKDSLGIAKAYKRGLTMSQEERKKRHGALLNNVKTETLGQWREHYLKRLSSVPSFERLHERESQMKRSFSAPSRMDLQHRPAIAKTEEASAANHASGDGTSSQAASLAEGT